MLEHKKIQNLSDYFVELNSRREKGVYFYRINGYSEEVGEFIKKYYDTARRTGVVIEGKIPNPDEGNLAYYNEIMGMDFQMSMDFIHVSLRKWLPRMNEFQRQNVAASIYDSLDSLRKAGKTENMLRNAYIKFMCWLYYKFERIVNQLGENHIPKILYEGQISNYELMLISILSNAGCDVVLLQYAGDQGYLKTDPGSVLSDSLQMEGLQPFPQGYCVKKVRDEIQNELNNERLYGISPSLTNCTNAWIKGNGLDDIRESILLRGNDSRFFYNCFCRINGAEDKLTYANELFRLQQELRNSKRNTVIVSKEIPRPTPQEISEIKRSNYTSGDQMLLGLACNIQYGANPELQRILHKTFVDVMLAESQKEGENLNRLTNRAVYLLCWLRRYMPKLFINWKSPEIGCFIYLGGCRNENEALFMSFLGRLPLDVLILCPDLNIKCCLEDKLLYAGDQGYLKTDPGSVLSDSLQMEGLQPFPQGYCVKKVRDEIQNELNNERLYGISPSLTNCTNAWIKGNGLDDIRESILLRGNDSRFFYNCFCRINGAEDKLTYANELFRLQQELRNSKRNTVIVSKEIPRPTPQEISEIKRSNYTSGDQMLLGLACNIQYGANPELQRILHKTFVDVMLAESQKEGENLNRLTNRAVYLLCWLRRYLPKLFINWKSPEIGCFIYLGGCRNENEALFMSFLGRLPLDVLILCPDLNIKCCLEDKLLYEVNYPESLAITEYPEESSQVKIGTAAYHAERELDTLMYQDSGIYRNQQYVKANVINLQTMYEEIKLLWDQELKYRPNFSTVNGVVNIPVIFSKISGVKDGSVSQYWESIAALITEDTVVVKSAPYIEPTASGPMKAFAVEFYKNGKLLRNKIKNHPRYPYHLLREEMQEFILDKLQLLIERKLIKGIGENGTEYTVIAQILDLPKEILRLIQKFDFTKKNPKLIYINTGETMISLQDSILVTFLNLAGFDILFFVPTGYQSVENYFAEKLMEEHQIGEYKYDMQVPDLNNISTNSTRPSWRRKLFRRG